MHEIWLKVKGWYEDQISTKAAAVMKKLSMMSAKVAQGVGGVVNMFSGMGGELAKVTNGLNGLLNGFAAMGPVGGVLAGLSVAIGWVTEKLMASEEAAKKLAEKHLAAMQKRLADMKATEIERLDKAIAKAADDADRAAKAFDAMAAVWMKVAQAKDATAAAGDTAEIAALNLEKRVNVDSAANDKDKGVKGQKTSEQGSRVLHAKGHVTFGTRVR